MQIIVITKNQKQYIQPMIDALNDQLPGVPRLFSVDRDPETAALLRELDEHYVENRENVDGFFAGKTRDAGLQALGISDTLFFDGDRVPAGLTPDIAYEALWRYDLTLIGIINDPRGDLFTENWHENPYSGVFENKVWTPGIILRGGMIKRIVDLQGGRLFHPAFDGRWGQEDCFLGDTVHFLGGVIGCCPESVRLAGGFYDYHAMTGYDKQVTTRHRLRQELLG